MKFSSSFVAQIRNWIYLLKTVKGNVVYQRYPFICLIWTKWYSIITLVWCFLIQSMVQGTKNIFLEPYKHKNGFYEVIQFENYPYLSKVWSLLGEGLIISLRVAGVPCRGRKTGEIRTGQSWGTSIYLNNKVWIKYRPFMSLVNVEINLEVKGLMNI